MYALGCVLWQLLAGRPPFPGGDPLVKLRAHQARAIDDVRKWAPDTPAALAEGIAWLTQRDPAQRPAHFGEVLERWGPPRRRGRRAVAGFLRRFEPFGGKVPYKMLHLGEASAHLFYEDAAALVVHALERQELGYHQYLPAQTFDVTNVPVPRLIERFYPNVRRTRPLESIDSLIDLTALERDLGWRPKQRLTVALAE